MGFQVKPGSIVSRKEYPILGAIELKLSNGMCCCCKKTNFLEDQVLLTGFAAGGLTEVPQVGISRSASFVDLCDMRECCLLQDEFRSASLAPVVANELGIFGVKPAIAADILAGKRVELKPGEGAFWRSFSGDESPDDLEIAFQLVHKLFTST